MFVCRLDHEVRENNKITYMLEAFTVGNEQCKKMIKEYQILTC